VNRPRAERFKAGDFQAALDIIRQSRGLDWKRVAAEAGVSASTLTRMKQGKRPDVDTLYALASWARLDLNAYKSERAS
jgi:transcriptional regulator with XRE-family HTH domain